MAGSQTDITRRKQVEARLVHDTLHDALTGLPNRHLFGDRLAQVLRSARRTNATYAVACIDLDRFQRVNDGLGHDVGDELMASVAARLTRAVRASDTVARLHGDEFGLLLADASDTTSVLRTVERLLQVLRAPHVIAGRRIVIDASIGVAFGGSRYDSWQALLRDADTALARAKAAGSGGFEVFDAAMHQAAVQRMHTEIELRHALERAQLVLHYQPIASLSSGSTVGFEALVRWQHPVRGEIGPAEFIPIAEDTGIVGQLGAWVLRQACRDLAAWRRATGLDLFVSVNLSPRQLHDRGLAAEIAAALGAAELDPSALKLEVTESALVTDLAGAAAVLGALRDIGVGLALDDFGTGYSSLRHLQRLPFTELKIDRSFVAGIGESERDRALIAAIVGMARSLGMDVVAEGIETPAQLEAVVALQCRLAQGYLISRPLPATRATDLLAAAAANG
jgi:diguanylate cyclase (GGDEF)-like protein